MKRGVMAILVTGLMAGPVYAGEADVLKAEVDRDTDGSYRFSVTVQHDDKGWKHYADRWEVLAPDGSVLGTRILYHPHVDEQPFTRSLSGVIVPEGVREVTIRAHDSVHEEGGKTLSLVLPD